MEGANGRAVGMMRGVQAGASWCLGASVVTGMGLPGVYALPSVKASARRSGWTRGAQPGTMSCFRGASIECTVGAARCSILFVSVTGSIRGVHAGTSCLLGGTSLPTVASFIPSSCTLGAVLAVHSAMSGCSGTAVIVEAVVSRQTSFRLISSSNTHSGQASLLLLTFSTSALAIRTSACGFTYGLVASICLLTTCPTGT